MTSAPNGYATVPTSVEPDYVDALLAMHDRDYPKALRFLDQVFKTLPGQVDAKELQALIFKSSGNTPAAIKTYEELLEDGQKKQRDPNDLALYHFELGMIHFGAGRRAQARPHFEEVAKSRVNTGPAQYFLGMIAYQESDWSRAEKHFTLALDSTVPELVPTCLYYLGLTYIQTGESGISTQSFFRARAAALAIAANPKVPKSSQKSADDIAQAADQALTSFKRGRWFGSMGLLTGYDTNVLAVPDSTASTTTTGQRSVTETVLVGLGHMSSPVNSWQFIPSYRAVVNLNANRDVRSGEFVNQRLSMYATKNALGRVSWGIKGAGVHVFQNNATGTNQKFQYEPYSLAGEFGPYLRIALLPRVLWSNELEYSPLKYYADETAAATSRRSGGQFSARSSLQFDRGAKIWNPTVSATYKSLGADGADYSLRSIDLNLETTIKLGSTSNLTPSLDLLYTNYYEHTTQARRDEAITFALAYSRRLSSSLTFLGNGSYAKNYSGPNQSIRDTYQYRRFAISMGVSYSLF